MELKIFQNKALEQLNAWQQELQAARQDLQSMQENTPASRKDILPSSPKLAWQSLAEQGKLPIVEGEMASLMPEYVERTADSGGSIPHVCMKVPTGGGKTLLGVASLGQLLPGNGFVLWIVPTKAIYEQSLKAFRTREHPYRQHLNQLVGGHDKIRILEKQDTFEKDDINNYICVMLLMLPSANRRKNTEFLKIFRDSGDYSSFFPQADDNEGHSKFKDIHRDLECTNDGRVKQSLINTLKLIRPIVILDEAHKAYGRNDNAIQEFVSSVNKINPSHVLELSATPKAGISNLLVNISGVELLQEEMIKLPMEVSFLHDTDWQNTLSASKNKLQQLSKASDKLYSAEGRYIRPIAVVRVQQTGKKQLGTGRIHAEDVRSFLINNLSVPERYIRVQSSENQELAGEDLLSDNSQVRWIISKDALKEGWDCSFAYVLVLLDNTSAATALTQMVGRVMRQPQAQKISDENSLLNRCYIYSYNQDVTSVVNQIKSGLENEGLTGLGSFIHGKGTASNITQTIVKRRKAYDKLDIFLPLVLHINGNTHRQLDYERDILSSIIWENIKAEKAVRLDKSIQTQLTTVVVDINRSEEIHSHVIESNDEIQLKYFARHLSCVPNPWQAARIAESYIQLHKKMKISKSILYNNRLYISDMIRQQVERAIDGQAEKVFIDKVNSKEICFHLQTNPQLNYKIQNSFEVLVPKGARGLQKETGTEIQRSLFEIEYENEYNSLEKAFALYLEEAEAISWWHRIAARQGYSIQGWRAHRVYPDFLVCRKDNILLILETKGSHLKGNEDTEYKSKLMGALEKAVRVKKTKDTDVFNNGVYSPMTFRIIFENEWKAQLLDLLFTD